MSLKGHLGWNYFILDYFYILLGLFVMLERYPAPKFSSYWFLPRFHFNKGGHLPPSLLPGIWGILVCLSTEQNDHCLLFFYCKCNRLLNSICLALSVTMTTHKGNCRLVSVLHKMWANHLLTNFSLEVKSQHESTWNSVCVPRSQQVTLSNMNDDQNWSPSCNKMELASDTRRMWHNSSAILTLAATSAKTWSNRFGAGKGGG